MIPIDTSPLPWVMSHAAVARMSASGDTEPTDESFTAHWKWKRASLGWNRGAAPTSFSANTTNGWARSASTRASL